MNANMIVGIVTFLMVSIMYVLIFKSSLKNIFQVSCKDKEDIYKVEIKKYINNMRLMKVALYFISGLLTYCSIVMDNTIILTMVLIAVSTIESIDNLIQYLMDKKMGC